MHASTLPVHPVTGRTALGWRKPRPGEDLSRAYPIWPVLGAAKEDDQDDDGTEGDDQDDEDDQADGGADADADDSGQDDDSEPDGADQLGDKGKRALDAMKAKVKTERERRRAAEAERDQLKTKPGNGDADQVRADADRQATARANSRILRSEIRAAAKGVLADPKDALTFLDLEKFDVDENGEVDEDEIADAIDELIKAKPYLAAATAKRFQGTGDGGAARKAGRPKQLTQADLKTMSAEAIDKARTDGRLDDLMSGK